MFTPLRPSLPGLDSASVDQSTNVVLTLKSNGLTVNVNHDGFSIGSSRQCDLTLADASIPLLHSVIHIQAGALWIETADESSVLLVNDRPYRRMALRHDDRLTIGNSELTVRLQPEAISMVEQAQTIVDEDLSLLTAEELCDRIMSEQSMVAEFAEGQRSGWDALLRAIESANDETVAELPVEEQLDTLEHEQAAFDTLLEQIQQLNETITDRTRELNDQEKEVLESKATLEEVQNRVTHRLDEILDQLTHTDPPNELRASA